MEAIASMAKDKGKNLLNLGDNLTRIETELKRLSCRASDLKQEVERAEQSGKQKGKREVENWFAEVQQVENDYNELKNRIEDDGFLRNLSSGDDVANLKARVELLMVQSQHFDGRLVLDVFDNIGLPCLPTKLFGKKFKRTLEIIWPCLVVDDISSIGIYGMGGVGKTTLAKHIKYHLEESNYCVHWVTVSQEFSVTGLQDKIANVLGIDSSDKDEQEMRANILRMAFNKKKLVLILDDVWEEFCVEEIGIRLGADKCRMILTTRSLQVCQRMCLQRNFDVTPLDTNEAWDLFKYTLGPQRVVDEEVENIAKSVAKRCAGLPLGVIVVAGSMRGVSDIREWRNTLDQLKEYSIGYDEMEHKVFPILQWSFCRLNGCERLCFLYCCLFREDRNISREELIHLFILADLIPRRNTRESEFDHGHKILNKLVKVCLLEESEDPFGRGSEYVKMHDIIRDMALRITQGKFIKEITGDVPRFLVKRTKVTSNLILEQNEWTEDLNAVSFFFDYGHRSARIEIPEGMSPICPKLSTLLFSHARIERIPESFFQHMNGLKVLNLNWCTHLKELPNSISYLVNLTSILLQGCRELKSIPSLAELKQLKELSLARTSIDDVPQGLEFLIKLERLGMHLTRIKNKIIPKGTFSKHHYLERLVLPFTVHISDTEVLKHLQKFRGCLSFMDVYNHLITSRCWPRHYRIVVLEESPPSSAVRVLIGNWNAYFSAFPNEEKQLMFFGCNFRKELDTILPDDIRVLRLNKCFGLSNVSFHHLINRLKDLSYLNITYSEELEFTLDVSSLPPDEEVASNLKAIQLADLPNFIGLVNFGGHVHQQLIPPPGLFSSLIDLNITRCHRLKKLFTVELLHQNLQNLERLVVLDCGQLTKIVADDDDDDDDDDERVREEIIFQMTQVRFSKLRILKLTILPVLESICNGTMICDSIEEIVVLNCPKLKRLPFGQSSPPRTLQKIKGNQGWWESLEWENSGAKDAFQPFFHVADLDFVELVGMAISFL